MNQTLHTNMLDHFFEGVYFVDPERRIGFWNRAAEKLTGFSREEVVGRVCADAILRHVTEDGTMLCFNGCPLQKTLSDGQDRETEIFLHHKDGHRVPVSVRVTPMRNDAGEIIGAMEVFRHAGDDITLRTRIADLEKEREICSQCGEPNEDCCIN